MSKLEVNQYEHKSCILLSDVNFVCDVFLWSPGTKLISSYTSFHTAFAGNAHSAISIFNNDHVEINKTF